MMDDADEPAMLLFGSQVESLSNKQIVDEISDALLDRLSRKWILETLAGLPACWNALVEAMPKITDAIGTCGIQELADVESRIRESSNEAHGGEFLTLDSLRSVVLSPLVVLTQLAQYRRFLRSNSETIESGVKTDLQAQFAAQKKTSTIGFCVGLLAAFAVASAKDEEGIDRYGSVAVRLAMIGGALIDAQHVWNKKSGSGPSTSFAVAWRNAKEKDDMQRIVNDLSPEAYISVLYDEARATVTVSERATSRLVRKLRAAAVTVAKVGFLGDIHSPKPKAKAQVDELVAFCDKASDLQFPDASCLVLPSYTNVGDGKPIEPDSRSLHEIALRAIFTQQCDWYGTLRAVKAARLDNNSASVVAFGPDRCVPATLARSLGSRLVNFADLPRQTLQVADHDMNEVKFCAQERAQEREQDLQQELQSLEPSSAQLHLREDQKDQEQPPLYNEDRTDTRKLHDIEGNAIAVVGMTIKVAGADDLDEFSKMLQTGKSQHELIQSDRIKFESIFRDGEKESQRQWFANFMRDVDAFDHKFFKRSPRESASMDPQQRLLLQAAYQAVEQSGYFTESTRSPQRDGRDKQHVGVYIGSPGVDYDHNVACHNANAFTATGTLQSFLAGKVSHYFGWTGPALTLDTACSSSAVAIHTACRNLLSGECNAALAGGVSLLTDPFWFQNLAAASFLSPTGQCKPFDEKSDGFCRAEGIGCVFLKRMSDAVADGNPILGLISSSAVYQNQNCTPLFVPNSPSLSQLFKDVIKQSNIAPGDISLVEAHGTGTPVGDPAEYDSIKEALGGPEIRSKPIPIGSVKGHIGHTEGTSGVVSLIKVLMMMRENYIPPQASFSRLNPAINSSPTDMMEVVTSLRPWNHKTDARRKSALINNYGAGGSNAAMVVTESNYGVDRKRRTIDEQYRLPFRITGFDGRSIKAYAFRLSSFVKASSEFEPNMPANLADLSFNINRHANPALGQSLIFNCSSATEVQDKLSLVASAMSSNLTDLGINITKPERPVILCFGGQVSTSIGLDRKLYDNVAILRHYLDECDAIMQSKHLGVGSIYPDIFSRTPCEDQVRLQTMLFAMQYACAKSWMDCGLSGKIVAVVGHSFGELTALCISGVLSLQDAIQLVAQRAQLVRDAWGPDRGGMMAVEADELVVQEMLTKSNDLFQSRCKGSIQSSVSIACYNGPRSFTLAGSVKAIDTAAETIAKNSKFSVIKYKRLNVTNAFHSSLVDPLLDRLDQVGQGMVFQAPKIPLERATETRFNDPMTSRFVSEHMRKPVFFHHAIQRLAKEHPSAIFLEAGSNSTITRMASRSTVGGLTASSSYHFQDVNITNENGMDGLTDATVSLWKQGLNVSFWAHHARQTNDYCSLLLPPYQFEKTRHWLEVKSPVEAIERAAERLVGTGWGKQQQAVADEKNEGMWSFFGYRDGKSEAGTASCPRFRINTGSEKYKQLLMGHVVAQTAPICPGTLQIDMAIEALRSLHPNWITDGFQPVISDTVFSMVLCIDPARVVWLDYTSLDSKHTQWEWKIISAALSNNNNNTTRTHTKGRLTVRSPTDAKYLAEFARLERLVTHAPCKALLATAGVDNAEDDVDVLQGRSIYRTFSGVIDYADIYRGLRSLVSRGNECAGRIHRKHTGETWLDVLLNDCFHQVSGIWVNCITDTSPDDMYIVTECDMSMRSPRYLPDASPEKDVWHVYARHTQMSDTSYMADIFVFDGSNSQLVESMLGIHYTRIAKSLMSRMLAKFTGDQSVLGHTRPLATNHLQIGAESAPISKNSLPLGQLDDAVKFNNDLQKQEKQEKARPSSPQRTNISDKVRNLVATVAGMEMSEVKLDTALADIGIDSLMGMELSREVDIVFKCKLPQEELLKAINVRQLTSLISDSLFRASQESGSSRLGDEDRDEDIFSSDHDELSDGSQDDSMATPPSFLDTDNPTSPQQETFTTMGLELSSADILQCFGEIKLSTDQQICDFHLDITDSVISAATSRLCVALIVEAFDQLGCSLSNAAAGDILKRVPFQSEQKHLVDWIYSFLETDARLIDVDTTSGQLLRTAHALPSTSSEAIMKELLEAHPNWDMAIKLIYHAGKPLAKILSGETDGIKVLFGSTESCDMMAAMYRDFPFAVMLSGHMRDLIGKLADKVQGQQGTLKILEIGGGTGGTTCVLVPFLASLNIAVEYTFTDLAPSMVAGARRRFSKQYPFVRFAVHDIEKPPAEELRGQHIVIASNAIHATRNLIESATNVRKALRPDGFLMMLEMTSCMPFSDLIYGLLDGWWMFNDGRDHVVASTERWEHDLHAAGFGHVDWTDGHLPEHDVERVMIALASEPQRERLPMPSSPPHLSKASQLARDDAAKQVEAERFVTKYTTNWGESADFLLQSNDAKNSTEQDPADMHKAVVVVTGATGSLGSHLVAALAEHHGVQTVVCMNRHNSSGTPAEIRQREAFSKRDISISSNALSKLRVLETETSRSQLGLEAVEYEWLVQHVTHIVHNAWSMSGTNAFTDFEPQFQTMRNLLDLALELACRESGGSKPHRRQIGFQFVSSIGVAGRSSQMPVLEDRVPLSAALPTGYSEAKWVCERMLEETLQKHTGSFRSMAVRPGQISGSMTSGAWNPAEHIALMVKSAQSLRAWPDLDGLLRWVPVDVVAAAMIDLLYIGTEANAPHASPIYHLDNSAGQPWKEMSSVIAQELNIPPTRLIPFRDWLQLVYRSPLQEVDNPSTAMVGFLEEHFENMACGGVVLDTGKARGHSRTMQALKPLNPDTLRAYINAWKEMAFLAS